MVHHLRGKRLEVKPGTPPTGRSTSRRTKRGWAASPWSKKYFAAAEKLVDPIDPTDPAWKIDPFKDWDQVTLAAWLKSQGASDEAIALMGHSLFFGHGWSTGSALHRLISDVALFYMGQTSHVIPGGMDLLPRAFAQALRERVWYGAPVTGIVQEADRVRIPPSSRGARADTGGGPADLRRAGPSAAQVAITPELPARKRQIIGELEYSRVTRLYLQARRRFWVDAGDLGRAFHRPADPDRLRASAGPPGRRGATGDPRMPSQGRGGGAAGRHG